MLVLSRKVGESIHIGDKIVITLVDIGPGRCRIGIEAPRDVPIFREELYKNAQLGQTPIQPAPAPVTPGPVVAEQPTS